MKSWLILISILIACAIGWAYSKHPEAFQDAIADLRSDPHGAHAMLEESRKEFTDLSETEKSMEAENKALKATILDLHTQIDRLKAPPPAPAVAKTFIPPSPLPAQPNWVWTATDGKTYNNVVVVKVEADHVSIMDDNGSESVDIATLPPDIQKQLNYDPALAAAAAAQRASDQAKGLTEINTQKQSKEDEIKNQKLLHQNQLTKETASQIKEDMKNLQDKINALNSQLAGNNLSPEQRQDASDELALLEEEMRQDNASIPNAPN